MRTVWSTVVHLVLLFSVRHLATSAGGSDAAGSSSSDITQYLVAESRYSLGLLAQTKAGGTSGQVSSADGQAERSKGDGAHAVTWWKEGGFPDARLIKRSGISNFGTPPGPAGGGSSSTREGFINGTAAAVEYSIVMPIYNQAGHITNVLESIVYNTVSTWEIILILDACTDETEKVVVDFFFSEPISGSSSSSQARLSATQLKMVTIIATATPGFEATSDNIGFLVAQGRYIVEIQADQIMMTYGYNHQLSIPVKLYPNEIFAVSGRSVHSQVDYSQCWGKCGELVEKPLCLNYENQIKVHISQTCNRGPLLFDRSRLAKLGYLDELHYILGYDDHDLMARAWDLEKLRCAYFPIEILSPLKEGSTRKPRSQECESALSKRKDIAASHKDTIYNAKERPEPHEERTVTYKMLLEVSNTR
jgi:Glycosyl transferase family 2